MRSSPAISSHDRMLPWAVLYGLGVIIFLSAFLLFQIQPMMGRYILPQLGGSAGVWTSCMLFFQLMLLLGYAYAHLLIHYATPRQQFGIHLTLITLSLLTLPVTPSIDWGTNTAGAPITSILKMLASHVALPFTVLAATTPLLGSWYQRANPSGAPYRLYAVSNTGSLLALLSYPFLVEPTLGLGGQGLVWTASYMVFAAGCAMCAWKLLPTPPIQAPPQPAETVTPSITAKEPANWREFATWVGFAGTGSVVLLSTTNQISQEVSVVPLLWVLPLSLYLVSFILCFERDRWYDRRVFVPLLVTAIPGVLWALNQHKMPPYWQLLSVYLFAMFICCMCIHGELARRRPPGDQQTRFYLALSIGGAVGGIFCAIIAPRVFASYWEYHLGLLATVMIVVVALLRTWKLRQRGKSSQHNRWITVIAVACTGLIVTPFAMNAIEWHSSASAVTRNFFGTSRITEGQIPAGVYREMMNGNISHGTQILGENMRRVPTRYYGFSSGLGIALRRLREIPREAIDIDAEPAMPPQLRLGAVGLGVGTVAAHARPGDYLRFYEINPDVERLARSHFSFLEDSPAEIEVIIGDARVELAKELASGQEQKFDLLILDAFSSDSVPVHLLTQEAYKLYREHLSPGGVLAFHTSNRYLALSANVREMADQHGDDSIRIRAVQAGWNMTSDSAWVLTGDNQRFFQSQDLLVEATPWREEERISPPWTDDFSSLWNALQKKNTRAPNKWKSAPNQGRFVFDTAGIIEPTTEDRIRRLSRALYWEREPQVPMMVFTTRALTGGQSVEALVNAMGLQHHPTQWQVLVLAVDEPRELHLHIGNSWSERERRYLISTLKRIETQSLQAQGLSKTLELIAQKVAFIVRQKSANRPASQISGDAQHSTAL